MPDDLYEYYSQIFEQEEQYDEQDEEDFYGKEASLDDLEEEEYHDLKESE